MGLPKEQDGKGDSERSSTASSGKTRLGGWIGIGRSGVLGKKTELKLFDGEVGVLGASGL